MSRLVSRGYSSPNRDSLVLALWLFESPPNLGWDGEFSSRNAIEAAMQCCRATCRNPVARQIEMRTQREK